MESFMYKEFGGSRNALLNACRGSTLLLPTICCPLWKVRKIKACSAFADYVVQVSLRRSGEVSNIDVEMRKSFRCVEQWSENSCLCCSFESPSDRFMETRLDSTASSLESLTRDSALFTLWMIMVPADLMKPRIQADRRLQITALIPPLHIL